MGPRIEKKSNASPFAKYYVSGDKVDLVLEISWVSECVALVAQVVSRHHGRLP